MDKRIRRNEICIVGLPRCDFAFSSTRTCFIAYGFDDSPLEVGILKRLLEERGIQAVEAGGKRAPGQNAFCAKICSKIITSQFSIVLINNEEQDGVQVPNANVNMEYGLMLGFNKYVIPFQRESQALPFNVAGLDTVKYTDTDFERLATVEIDAAIEATRPDSAQAIPPDQIMEVVLLSTKALINPIDNDGDRNIFQMGKPLGFALLNDFSGMTYIYFGVFPMYRPEVVLWRLRLLKEILDGRRASLEARVQIGVATEAQVRILEDLLARLQIWVLVTSEDDKKEVQESLASSSLDYECQVFSMDDFAGDLSKLSVPST